MSGSLKKSFLAVLVLAVLVVVPVASAEQYVLYSNNWGNAQNDAVAAAGGSIEFAHGKAGVGLVSSDNPGFLDQVLATNAFKGGELDQVVQWQEPMIEQVITPNDEGFFPLQWNMQAMEAEDAWATGCTGAGVRVAILDGGIYDIHADLEPNLDKACSVSFVPGQAYNTDTGNFWHGTHVAGIVAAADNGFGVIGVAPEATLMGVKVLHSGSGSFGWVIGGILYAADPSAFGLGGCAPADIINMSLGALFPKSASGGGPLVAALNKAVNFAASKGVLVVSAAGNNGLDMDHTGNFTIVPAESGSGVAISATGPTGFANGATNFRRPSSYTNYGNSLVHVAAPGGDFTLFPNGLWFYDMVLSTSRGTSTPPSYSFSFAAGTSMASPAAAGVAALIKSANPGISLGALKSKLANTADDEGANGHDPFYGRGFVNARRACTE